MTIHNARKTSIRLTLFNHKGGVGKTTLAVNIAFSMAAIGKRVLLVDSDPQCNLTSYLVESDVVDKWLDESDKPRGTTVWSALGPVVNLGQEVKPILPFERAKRVFLIPGDIRLSEYELELQQSWIDCLQRKQRGFKSTMALSTLVDICAKAVKADFVLYDVGPNIGPLNRAILLDCDYFIVPAACDYFSTRALKTLGHSVANWIKDWDVISKLAPDDFPRFLGRPVYLGYILQRFRMYGGDLTHDFKDYARQLDRHSYSDVAAVLKDIGADLAPSAPSQFKLGQIKDFGALANRAQQQGVAMSDADGGTPYLRDQAESAFRKLAANIIERV